MRYSGYINKLKGVFRSKIEAYNKLSQEPSIHYNCSPSQIEFPSVLAQLSQHVNEIVKVSIHDVTLKERAKQVLKKHLNKS